MIQLCFCNYENKVYDKRSNVSVSDFYRENCVRSQSNNSLHGIFVGLKKIFASLASFLVCRARGNDFLMRMLNIFYSEIR